jgi:hypothetical protein
MAANKKYNKRNYDGVGMSMLTDQSENKDFFKKRFGG